MSDETELAPSETVTGSIYAWGALDYDDPDEFPTVPIRLSPRRITALGLAASLVVIAVAGAVALGVMRDRSVQIPNLHTFPSPTTTVVAAPTVTMTLPPPVTVTVQAAPPPPVVAAPTPTPRYPYADEAGFVSAVRSNIPQGWMPGWTVRGGSSIPPTDSQLIAAGYQACRLRDSSGSSAAMAALWPDTNVGASPYPMTFMSYVTMLCNPEIG